MINLDLLKELRAKEELIEYFKSQGKNITSEEIDALKQSYDQTEKTCNTLTMKQLDKIAGGINNFGFMKDKSGKLQPFRISQGLRPEFSDQVIIQHDGMHKDSYVRDLRHMSLSDLYDLRDFAQQNCNQIIIELREILFSINFPNQPLPPNTDEIVKLLNSLEKPFIKAKGNECYETKHATYIDIFNDIKSLNSIIEKRENRRFNFQIAGIVLFTIALGATDFYLLYKIHNHK